MEWLFVWGRGCARSLAEGTRRAAGGGGGFGLSPFASLKRASLRRQAGGTVCARRPSPASVLGRLARPARAARGTEAPGTGAPTAADAAVHAPARRELVLTIFTL